MATYFLDGIYFDESSPINFDNGNYFDSGSLNSGIFELDVSIVDTYLSNEYLDVNIVVEVEVEQDYANYVDLLQFVPEKFRESVPLQELLYVFGIQAGTWIGNVSDIQLLLDKYSVGDDYIQYLSDLLDLSLLTTDATTLVEKRRQLDTWIDLIKMKGTYQAIKYITYMLGINVNIWDLYTMDYATFTRAEWFAGGLLENPIGSTTSNFLLNYDFETWSSGPSAFPDNWIDPGGDITPSKESAIVKVNLYSFKVKASSWADAQPYQNLVTAEHPITYWQGKTLTFGCWVYSLVANQCFLSLVDGGITNSSYQTVPNTWQFLTVTRTVSSSATYVRCYFQIKASHTAYFDGAVCVEGTEVYAYDNNFFSYYKSPHIDLEIALNKAFS